jgi:hypothetical protein
MHAEIFRVKCTDGTISFEIHQEIREIDKWIEGECDEANIGKC